MKQQNIDFPESWDEMTEADWSDALRIRQRVVTHPGRYTVDDILLQTARCMLTNRGVKAELKNPQYLLLVGQLGRTLAEWLWQLDGDQLSLTWRSTKNCLPEVRQWTGPVSHGEDLTFGEFRQAFAMLKAIEAEDSEDCEPMCMLAGHLYRPAATPEQQHERQLSRQPWNWDTLETKLHRGEAMEPWQRWGIYSWFAYFCEYLVSGTFIIDGEQVSFEPLFLASPDSQQSDTGRGSLQQIALTLAESHVFGTLRDVDDAPLLTVLQKLLMDYDKLMELKKRQKTINKR